MLFTERRVNLLQCLYNICKLLAHAQQLNILNLHKWEALDTVMLSTKYQKQHNFGSHVDCTLMFNTNITILP